MVNPSTVTLFAASVITLPLLTVPSPTTTVFSLFSPKSNRDLSINTFSWYTPFFTNTVSLGEALATAADMVEYSSGTFRVFGPARAGCALNWNINVPSKANSKNPAKHFRNLGIPASFIHIPLPILSDMVLLTLLREQHVLQEEQHVAYRK